MMPMRDGYVSEDILSRADFNRLAAFVHDYSGIRITFPKKGMLEGRLRRRLRDLNLPSLEAYCRFLFEAGGLADETTALIDAVTTNKTDFFREPHHFQFLLERVLPEHPPSRPLRLWSAGCSNGAEPYTASLVCDWYRQKHSGFRYEILATDICTTVLGDAVRAVYPHEQIEPVPMVMRRDGLLRHRDRSRDLVRIAPQIRAAVRFEWLNLMDRTYPVETGLDLIFCRNLLIYFERETQEAVLKRLCRHLRPGGHLMLGHSESIVGYDLPVRPVGTTIFRKAGEA